MCNLENHKSLPNNFCIFRWDTHICIIGIIVFLLLMLFYTFMYFKASAKQMRLTEENPQILNEQTYSVLSLMMIKLAKVLILVEVVHMGFYVFKLALEDNYRYLFLTEYQQSCKEYPEDQSIFDVVTKLQLIHLSVYQFIRILRFNILMLQVFEWHAMIYIIQSQRHRTVEEILYDHNNEKMSEAINRSTDDSQKDIAKKISEEMKKEPGDRYIGQYS